MSLSKEDLQTAMAAAGVKWGVRAKTLLTPSQGEAGFGLGLGVDLSQRVEMLAEAKALERMSFRAVAPPPPSIDWRNVGGKNYVTDVRDQSTCGSCVAFATIATVEALLNIADNKPGRRLDLSEANLFNCGGGVCASGWNFVPAITYGSTHGLGLEKDQPYAASNATCRKIPMVARIKGYTATSTTIARKQAISSRGPVIAGMSVFEDFYHYRNGVYRHVAGQFLGYHAVCVVGYDDKTQCWIVKNSWRSNWGEKGYFRIGYGECGIDSQFAFYDVEPVALKPL